MIIRYIQSPVISEDFTLGEDYEVLNISHEGIFIRYDVIDDNGRESFLLEGECKIINEED